MAAVAVGMDMRVHWYDVLGLTGVALITAAYLAIQMGRIKSNLLLYSVWNGVGALFVLISLAFDFNLSAFVVEAFWLVISAVGVWRWWSTRKGDRMGIARKA
jgi:hypothetical protein